MVGGSRLRLIFFRNFEAGTLGDGELLDLCGVANEIGAGLVFEDDYYFLDRSNKHLPPTARLSITDSISALQTAEKFSAKAPVFLLSRLEPVLGVSNLGCAWADLLNNKDQRFNYIKTALLDMSSFF